jgi:DNA modification methylase
MRKKVIDLNAHVELKWAGKHQNEDLLQRVIKRDVSFELKGRYPGSNTTHEDNPDQVSEMNPGASANSAANNNFRNRLYHGEAREVCTTLLDEFAGKINLIYIDPPFQTGSDFSYPERIGQDDQLTARSVIQNFAYRDDFDGGLAAYLSWFQDLMKISKALLHEHGSLYVHLDSHVVHLARFILDEIFGEKNFRAEIIWKRTTKLTNQRNYGLEHDNILFYSKTNQFSFHQQFKPIATQTLIEKYRYLELADHRVIMLTRPQRMGAHSVPSGRRFRCVPLLSMNQDRPNLCYEFRGFTRMWGITQAKMEDLESNGLIYQARPDCLPMRKSYLEESKGAKCNSIWDDIPQVNSQSTQKVGYVHQKPEKLLERILLTSSEEGDLILDPCCGSGTTLAMANILNRHWLGIDLSWTAGRITQNRLMALPQCRAFDFYGQSVSRSGEQETLHKSRVLNIQTPAIQQSKIEPILDIVASTNGLTVILELKYLAYVSGTQIQETVRNKCKLWSDYVNGWIIDWDYSHNYFQYDWSSYRTFRSRELSLVSDPHQYNGSGQYKIAVKVWDIFGEETISILDVNLQ